MSEVSEAAFPTAPAAAAFAVFPCPSSGPAHAFIFAGGRFYCSKCGLFIVLEGLPNSGIPLLAVDDVLLREFIEYLPDDDMRAVALSCQPLGRVISSPPYSRTIHPPSPEHILSSLALTKWALETEWVWPKQRWLRISLARSTVVVRRVFIPGACEVAAGGGCHSVLELARSHDCPWDFRTCSSAARGGYLEVL